MAVTETGQPETDTDAGVEAGSARRRRLAFGAFMLGAGIMHFVTPRMYQKIVPRWMGDARRIVVVSGIADMTCGALMLNRRTAKAGGWLTAALLVFVFPANVQMVLDSGTEYQALDMPIGRFRAMALARLPLQVPMVRWAVGIARSAS